MAPFLEEFHLYSSLSFLTRLNLFFVYFQELLRDFVHESGKLLLLHGTVRVSLP